MAALTILHTSDWHIGHQLYRNRRDDEFKAFLAWLGEVIAREHVDVLLVAGDVFDVAMPSTSAQSLYYDFLSSAAASGARHIVITAGNHDSPSFLTAPRQLLEGMRISVVGAASANPGDEVIVLRDQSGNPQAIVCAAPFLRERDIRSSQPGEGIEARERSMVEGVRTHYQTLAGIAVKKRDELGGKIPIIATGHLHAMGALSGTGVRDLYIGGLGAMTMDIFPPVFDYVALGHFHKPQKVGGMDTRRYCGSPLPMGFDELSDSKEVVVVRFNNNIPEIRSITVPRFRAMLSIRGGAESILSELGRLRDSTTEDEGEIWIEVRYAGNEPPGDLLDAMDKLIRDTPLRVLCVKREGKISTPGIFVKERDLSQIEPMEMFDRLLEMRNLDGAGKKEMRDAFQELLADLRSG